MLSDTDPKWLTFLIGVTLAGGTWGIVNTVEYASTPGEARAVPESEFVHLECGNKFVSAAWDPPLGLEINLRPFAAGEVPSTAVFTRGYKGSAPHTYTFVESACPVRVVDDPESSRG